MDELMIIEIKELIPSESYLVDLTNTELNKVKGGYLPFVGFEIGARKIVLWTAAKVSLKPPKRYI